MTATALSRKQPAISRTIMMRNMMIVGLVVRLVIRIASFWGICSLDSR